MKTDKETNDSSSGEEELSIEDALLKALKNHVCTMCDCYMNSPKPKSLVQQIARIGTMNLHAGVMEHFIVKILQEGNHTREDIAKMCEEWATEWEKNNKKILLKFSDLL